MRNSARHIVPLSILLAFLPSCGQTESEEGEPGACAKCDSYSDEELEAALLEPIGSRQLLLESGGTARLDEVAGFD